MSSQNNWNNPDMYYQQPQSGPPMGSGYAGSNVNYAGAGYGSNADYVGAGYGSNAVHSANSYGGSAQHAGAGAGPAYGYQPLPPTNTMAIIALVASIYGVMSSFFIAGVAGIIMGHIARKQIRQSGERGDGIAVGALWVGYIGVGLWVAFWLFFAVIYLGIFAVIFAAS